MIRTVYAPGYREDVVFNSEDVDQWQYNTHAVIGQGSRSGKVYLVTLDDASDDVVDVEPFA